MGRPVLSLLQIFQKMLEREIKHELLMEIYKEYLRRQYGLNRKLERTIWVGLYYLLKTDENFVKGQYGSNLIIVFYDFFCRTPVLEIRINSEIEGTIWLKRGRYGSRCSNGQFGSLGEHGLEQDLRERSFKFIEIL